MIENMKSQLPKTPVRQTNAELKQQRISSPLEPLLVRAVASGRTSVLPVVSNRCDSIAVSTVTVEIQSITILVVVPPLRFLPTLISAIISTIIAALLTALIATILTAVVTIRVSGQPTVIPIASNFPVLEIRVSSSCDRASFFFPLQLVLFHKVPEHPLQPLARNLHLANGPDRRQEFPSLVLA